MKFISLESDSEFKKISEDAGSNIIFKHNTTCPISKSVHRRLEQEADQLPSGTPVYVLDLLAHRDLSDAVAKTFDVVHESPQLLVINNGKCIYNESLYAISPSEAAMALQEAES